MYIHLLLYGLWKERRIMRFFEEAGGGNSGFSERRE
jgi:hypothetical protein